MGPVTFTDEEGEDLANIVRWALQQGIGYGHVSPEDQATLERKREAMLAKIVRPLERSKARERHKARKAQQKP